MKRICLLLCCLTVAGTVFSQKDADKTKVEGWYFRAVGAYPGAISFKPLVLFGNGDYYKVNTTPIAELDLISSKEKEAERWGRWKKTGERYMLTANDGKTNAYDLNAKNWFPAFPFEESLSLRGTYEKISGGDFGNGLLALFDSELTFLDDTRFTHSENNGILTAGSDAWKNNSDSGTYKIEGHTISFRYNDGRTTKLSFAIGAQGDNVIDTDMLFIGGKAYIIE
ncbi:hypothetical protein [Maribacter sp. 2-571]|uniref:hypothetical protein n=1 Tax=Maribacter sp. 2-571 TaxID=3417569 RepID=UPI003D32646F